MLSDDDPQCSPISIASPPPRISSKSPPRYDPPCFKGFEGIAKQSAACAQIAAADSPSASNGSVRLSAMGSKSIARERQMEMERSTAELEVDWLKRWQGACHELRSLLEERLPCILSVTGVEHPGAATHSTNTSGASASPVAAVLRNQYGLVATTNSTGGHNRVISATAAKGTTALLTRSLIHECISQGPMVEHVQALRAALVEQSAANHRLQVVMAAKDKEMQRLEDDLQASKYMLRQANNAAALTSTAASIVAGQGDEVRQLKLLTASQRAEIARLRRALEEAKTQLETLDASGIKGGLEADPSSSSTANNTNNPYGGTPRFVANGSFMMEPLQSSALSPPKSRQEQWLAAELHQLSVDFKTQESMQKEHDSIERRMRNLSPFSKRSVNSSGHR